MPLSGAAPLDVQWKLKSGTGRACWDTMVSHELGVIVCILIGHFITKEQALHGEGRGGAPVRGVMYVA